MIGLQRANMVSMDLKKKRYCTLEGFHRDQLDPEETGSHDSVPMLTFTDNADELEGIGFPG